MTRFISDILEAREPHFSQQIAELEKIAGKPGVDVRLVSDLIQQRKSVLKSLGMDETDTSTAELYHALIEKALADSKSLAEKIGIMPEDKPDIAVDKAIKFVRSVTGNNRIWTLRQTVAKKQLKENPPNKLMKVFSLRSIDSALKREPISLLFTFAKKTEPKKWYEKYVAQAGKLSPADFDYQNIEVSQVSNLRQSQLKKTGLNLNQIVYLNYDVAGIVIITPKKRFDGDVLFLVHSILENIRLLKSGSLYMKVHSMELRFNDKVGLLRDQGFASLAKEYKNFGWNAYLRHLTSQDARDDDGLELILEEDLKNHNISHVLGDDSLWRHNFLLTPGEKFVASCNLSDVILNAVNRHEPHESHYYFGQRELQDELFGRYIKIPKIRQHIEEEANNG